MNANRAHPIRVVIADDDRSIREVLIELIDADDSVTLVGVAATGLEAVAVCREQQPDVALMDVRMPGGGGITAVRKLKTVAPTTRVLVLSAYADSGAVTEMIRAGAVGYLVKGTSVPDIRAAIKRASRGEPSLSQEVAPVVVEELREQLRRDDDARAQRRAKVARIRQVLDEGGLSVAFQPIVNIVTREPVGFEALARFSTNAAARPPNEWFADAEAVGLGVELELAAIGAAIAASCHLPTASFLSLNVGPTVAVSERLAYVLRDVDPARTVLEITEHAPIVDYDALAAALEPLRTRGVRLAVDDAGAGFASLRHILRLRPDFIKLDTSLTRDIDLDVARRALARGLTTFGTEIGSTIIGEGVEKESELKTLSELGVTTAQGYFLGAPRPAAETSPTIEPLKECRPQI
jgi:EAL domain-containing protein (putative c-di-GMP-specific phosphodiesterase class I)/DNA-binding NarL/FixJ family response regulator